MPKEDYLLKYLEKLSRVIAAIFGFRDKGFLEDAIRLADETFKELLNINLETITVMPVEKFISTIKAESYNSSYIEALAKITHETAGSYLDLNIKNEANVFFLKALYLYRYLNEKDKTFSFEREQIIAELEQITSHSIE